MFALSIDNEHTFCYLIENVKKNKRSKGQERRVVKMKRTNKKYRIKSKFRFITFIVIILGLAVGTIGYITGFDISTALEQPKFM